VAPAFTLSTANAAGASTSVVAHNSTILAFDTTVPAALETAAASGSGTTAAYRNHVHEFPETLQSDANSLTLTFSDDATDGTLTLSSGDLNFAGDVAFNTHVAIGSGTAVATNNVLKVFETTTTTATDFVALNFNMTADPSGGTRTAKTTGIAGNVTSALLNANNVTGVCRGMYGTLVGFGSGTISDFRGYDTDQTRSFSPVTTGYGYRSSTPLDTTQTQTTGYGFYHEGWGANTTTKWAFYAAADRSYFGDDVRLPDSKKLVLGTGQDAEVYYDGTDLVLNPQAVGSGTVKITDGGFGVFSGVTKVAYTDDTGTVSGKQFNIAGTGTLGATSDWYPSTTDTYSSGKAANRWSVVYGVLLNVTGAATLGGDLNHDGSNIGFFGTAPVALRDAYTLSNDSTVRTYNANSTTLNETADVLCTLIKDLIAYGLLQ
jgi:hypothetical protein